jgi:excisionase family DNA binding protein
MSNPSTLPDTLFSINEIADHAGVHHNTVRRWINLGKLPAIRLGSTLRIKGAVYNKFCEPAGPRSSVENDLSEYLV